MQFKLEIAYDGTNYAGWQRQPKKISVQQVIEEKLSYLYASKKKVSVKGAGRTDSGVHAQGMIASFVLPSSPVFSNQELKKAMNSILPGSIFLKSAETVDLDFNPRFSAVGKAYTYVISKCPPSPFLQNWCWHKNNLNIEYMQKAAKHLTGTHNFSAFTVKIRKTEKNPVRKIYRIETNNFDNFICFTFIGESFLYKMIRSLMGTLVEVGTGKISPEDVKPILESKDRSKAHITAPAKGLFLMKVFYDSQELENYKLLQLPFLVNTK